MIIHFCKKETSNFWSPLIETMAVQGKRVFLRSITWTDKSDTHTRLTPKIRPPITHVHRLLSKLLRNKEEEKNISSVPKRVGYIRRKRSLVKRSSNLAAWFAEETFTSATLQMKSLGCKQVGRGFSQRPIFTTPRHIYQISINLKP